MTLTISGKIIKILPLASGVSTKTGKEWQKQEYILATTDSNPKVIHFAAFGADRIAGLALVEGRFFNVDVDIESREYNGRWYTSINAWRATPVAPPADPYAPAPQAHAQYLQDQAYPPSPNHSPSPVSPQPAPSLDIPF